MAADSRSAKHILIPNHFRQPIYRNRPPTVLRVHRNCNLGDSREGLQLKSDRSEEDKVGNELRNNLDETKFLTGQNDVEIMKRRFFETNKKKGACGQIPPSPDHFPFSSALTSGRDQSSTMTVAERKERTNRNDG